jgi:hypothetical protein
VNLAEKTVMLSVMKMNEHVYLTPTYSPHKIRLTVQVKSIIRPVFMRNKPRRQIGTGTPSSGAALGGVTFNYAVTPPPTLIVLPMLPRRCRSKFPQELLRPLSLACNIRTVNSDALVGSNVGTKLSLPSVSVPQRIVTAAHQ